MAFENIAKSLYVANQLPLDEKTYFATLTQMRDLGVSDYRAFQYYEYMKVMCAETGTEYVWKEVDENDTNGVLPQNFQYPANTVTEGVDYSNRWFNFVPAEVTESFVIPQYIIWKSPKNDPSKRFLEVDDVAMGFFALNDFRFMRYTGGPVTSNSSWADMDNWYPDDYPQNS